MHSFILQFEYKEVNSLSKQSIFDGIIVKMDLNPRDFAISNSYSVSEMLRLELIDWREDDCKGIVNVLSKENGDIFKKRINSLIQKTDKTCEFGIKIVYDSYSVEYMNSNRENIFNFELLLRVLITEIMLEQCGNEFFALFDSNLNICEYINLGSEKFEGCIRSFERIGLEKLYEYIEHHWLGGDEYRVLFEAYNANETTEEKKTILNKILRKDIFKDIKKLTKNKINDIKSIRNAFAHNTYIDVLKVDEFIKGELLDLNKEFYSMVKHIQPKEENDCMLFNKEFVYITKHDFNKTVSESIEENLKLELTSILLNLNIVIDQSKISFESNIMVYRINDYQVLIKVISNETDSSYCTYVHILHNEQTLPQNIFKKVFKEQALILFETTSVEHSISILNDISYIENLFRIYLNFLEYANTSINLPNNRVNMTSFSYKDGVIDNRFYNFDFITLSEIYVNLDNRETTKLKTQLFDALDKNKEEFIDKIFENVEDDYERIRELEQNWRILYDYRTKAVHLGLINNTDYIAFKDLLKRTKKILYQLFNKLIMKEFDSFAENEIHKYYKDMDDNLNIEYSSYGIKKLQLKCLEGRYIKICNISFTEATLLFQSFEENKDTQIYLFTIESLIDLIKRSDFQNKSREMILEVLFSTGINIEIDSYEGGVQHLANEINSLLNSLDECC